MIQKTGKMRWMVDAGVVTAHPIVERAAGKPATLQKRIPEQNADARSARIFRPSAQETQGVSGLLADFLALTSATALSIAAMRCASAGWLAVWPFSTVAGVVSAKRFQNPEMPSTR